MDPLTRTGISAAVHVRPRVFARLVAAAAGLLLLTSCAAARPPVEATTVRKPPPVHVSEAERPLPLGRESAYELVNAGNRAAADDLLRDVWQLPRFPPATLGSPLSWNEDPYKQKYWRFIFYSLRPTSNLLWAYYRTGDAKYRTKLLEILDSYLRHDTLGRAVDTQGFDDPYAIAFRAMQLTNTYAKLKRSNDLPADLSIRLLDNIARTGAMLMAEANFQVDHNHGFSEAAALLILHENFPQLDPAGVWRAASIARLLAFFAHAVDAEGVEVEKSPFYHFYVYKFALQLVKWAQANSIDLPAALTDRIKQMGNYAAYVLWPNGTIPLVGSSVELTPAADGGVYDQAMSDNPELAYGLTGGTAGTPPAIRAKLFGLTGQAVLRSPVDSEAKYSANSQLIMDVGPPQTKHSHHEALAVNYYSAGRELLVDSGLDTYSSGQAFDYFHGSTAHNTVVVDGQDQLSGAITPGLTTATEGWAYQSGTASVYPGVTHRRSVLLLARDVMLVVDSLSADKPHSFEQLWHIFPGAHVVDDGLHTKVFDDHDNPVLDIRQAPGGAIEGHRYYGQLSPLQGWFSSEYGRNVPNHVASYRTQAASAVYLTLVTSGPYAGRGGSVRGTVTGTEVSAAVCVDGFGAAAVHIAAQSSPGETVFVTRESGCTDAS
jgi:hypothetical protein